MQGRITPFAFALTQMGSAVAGCVWTGIPSEEARLRLSQCLQEQTREMIQLKRVYDPAGSDDGVRFLVERLWPRGIRKENLRLDGWLKDVAPSTELRQWFNHDPAKWAGFQQKYFAELDAKPDALEPILKASAHGTVTLLFSSHDTVRNNAVALKAYIAAHKSRRGQK